MRTNSSYIPERKLFGYALTIDPLSLAIICADDTPKDMPYSVTEYVSREAIAENIIKCSELRSDLFRAAIQDTQTLYESIRIDVSNHTERIVIASHSKTMESLAQLALEPLGSSDSSLGNYGQGGNNFRLSDDRTHIMPINTEQPSFDSGCPFAGNNRYHAVDPLFTKFNEWSMRLIFSHDEQIKKTP